MRQKLYVPLRLLMEFLISAFHFLKLDKGRLCFHTFLSLQAKDTLASMLYS